METKYPLCRPASTKILYPVHDCGVNQYGCYQCKRCHLLADFHQPAVLALYRYITLNQLKESLKVAHIQGDWKFEFAKMKVLKEYMKMNRDRFLVGIYSYDDIFGPNSKNFINPNNKKEENL